MIFFFKNMKHVFLRRNSFILTDRLNKARMLESLAKLSNIFE